MPFQSDKQRRYLWANEPEIAREWTDRYGASEGGITRLPFQQGNWANWVGNNPWKSGAAVVGPLAAAAGVQSMQDINAINKMARMGNYSPSNPMPQAFMDKLKGAYTPSSVFKKTGYPTGLGNWFLSRSSPGHFGPVEKALQVGKHLGSWGGTAATGLPLGYAALASGLQENIPEELQGVMSEDIISQGAMGAGAGQDIEWDETLREEGGGLADLFSNLGISSANAEPNFGNAVGPNPETDWSQYSEPSVRQGFGDEAWQSDPWGNRAMEQEKIDPSGYTKWGDTDNFMEYINKNPELMQTMKDKVGGIWESGIDKGQWALGAAGAAAKMPFQLLAKAANIVNPLSKGSRNYNPDLQNQIDILKASGDFQRLSGDDPSGPYRITSGPLAGKNLVSGFGTNDYGRMLDKRISYFRNKKSLTEAQTKKMHETIAEKERVDREAKKRAADAAAAAQVRSNIQRYGNRDRPNTGMNTPGGGKGQSPTGGDVSGTPFAQGGLVR